MENNILVMNETEIANKFCIDGCDNIEEMLEIDSTIHARFEIDGLRYYVFDKI
jgi:hypothetical protein